MGVGHSWVNLMPQLLYPQELPQYPLYRHLGGPGLDGYGKSHPPPGFDPRTIQPVVSRIPITLPWPNWLLW